MYELRTSPNNAAILKNILCKASYPDNNQTIQLIPYGIQESQTRTSTNNHQETESIHLRQFYYPHLQHRRKRCKQIQNPN